MKMIGNKISLWIEGLKEKKKKRLIKKDYVELMTLIMSKVKRSESIDEIKNELNMLRGLGNKGDSEALCLLANIYAMEDKNWYNPGTAESILKECAENGMPAAQFWLGFLYYNGNNGHTPDPISGLYWIRKADLNGYQYANEFLRLKGHK